MPSSLTQIESGAFYDCSSIENIIVLNDDNDLIDDFSLLTKITKIEDNTFMNCKSLKKMNISSSVTFIGDSAFYCCESLNQLNIPSSLNVIQEGVFFWMFIFDTNKNSFFNNSNKKVCFL